MAKVKPGAAEMGGVLEACYARRSRQLWSFGRRLGLDPGAAEDVMQEAFVRALQFDPRSISDLDAWLFRVVHNLAVDAIRHGGYETTGPEPAVVDGSAHDDRLDLWRAVDRLPERQRAVLYLRYRADLKFDAIAGILGISEGGARANGARGLTSLRKWMGTR